MPSVAAPAPSPKPKGLSPPFSVGQGSGCSSAGSWTRGSPRLWSRGQQGWGAAKGWGFPWGAPNCPRQLPQGRQPEEHERRPGRSLKLHGQQAPFVYVSLPSKAPRLCTREGGLSWETGSLGQLGSCGPQRGACGEEESLEQRRWEMHTPRPGAACRDPEAAQEQSWGLQGPPKDRLTGRQEFIPCGAGGGGIYMSK